MHRLFPSNKVQTGFVTEHPNQYFDESRKYLSGEVEKPKAAQPGVAVNKGQANSSSQGSMAVDDDVVRLTWGLRRHRGGGYGAAWG